MDYSIFSLFRENENIILAPKMAKYMKNHFVFLGLNSPIRKELQHDFLKNKIKEKQIDWVFVFECFRQPEREFQYLALDYLGKIKKSIPASYIDKIEKLIQTKSWWDSVDGLDQVVGAMSQNFPDIIDSHIRNWMTNSNIWLKRVSINFQLGFREKTIPQILEEAILKNVGTKEFFINKAIGWSLREYSKTDSVWVANFIETHQEKLSNLSLKEANKYLK
jgi:3-methyladenine DNA glycosylase AlkD